MGWVYKNTPIHKRTGFFYEGKEIALHKGRGYSEKRRNKKVHLSVHRKNWWPEDKKIEAATVYAVVRKFNQTAELTGIPIDTIKKWSDEPWWTEIIAKVKKEKNEVLDAKISDILESAMDNVIDRLKDGDYYYNRATKSVERMPVKAKDAAVSAAILFDKRQLLRGEVTSRSESKSADAKLLELKQNFEKLARSKGINPDGEVIEDGVQTESETETQENDSNQAV